MIRFNKLSRDTRPQEQPDGTFPFGKNGVFNFVKNAVINEPGFLPSSAQIPYVPMGIIETDKNPVVFSSNNTNSAIGYYDAEKDVYIPILNDASLPFKLGFKTDRFITGQAQRNYKQEVVVAFTDKHDVKGYLNCDNPDVNSPDDLSLFPIATPPKVSLSVQTGGTLYPGAYFASVKLLKNDGTETGYLVTSSPAIISGTTGELTDKSIQVKVSEIDVDYDMVQVAIISRIAGVTKAISLTPVSAKGAQTISYTGAELTTDVSLEEILVQPAVYDSIGAIGQLNDSLYIVDLKSSPEVQMQKYANMIRLRWQSELVSVSPADPDMESGAKKTFTHQEVYAFYIRYLLKNGRSSKAFVIPGLPLLAAHSLTSTPGTAEGFTQPVFQLEDTIESFDPTTRTGLMGRWKNSTELYPDTDDFDSSAVGGPNLRNQPVLHHRFPSIAWCKQNLYANNLNYGKTELDRLSVRAENIIIPPQYKDLIVGYELLYAKRTPANSTVLGQSLLLFGAQAQGDTALNTYYSTGGNFNSVIDFKTSPKVPLNINQSIFRMHPFDVLFNRPSIEPTHLSPQLTLSRVDLTRTGGYIEDQAIVAKNDGPMVYALDYIDKGLAPTVASTRIKRIKESQYVPNNLQLGKWQNRGVESAFGGILANPTNLINPASLSGHQIQPGSRRSYTPNDKAVQHETTFLTNIMATRADVYVPFSAQTLVRAGSTTLQRNDFMYGGDSFISDYSFHTYGWFQGTGDGGLNTTNQMFEGTKIVRRFICETASNLYARTEIAANEYSRYYPKSSLVPQDGKNYLTNFSRTQDPNQFGYSKDLNALDDLIVSDIYNTFKEDVTEHPHRIHRSGKMLRQTKNRSWRTFLPLDYYEAQKNMGRIINVEGMDDRLIIHHENAMFLTQDKTKLESDILSITLGSGDIFQFQPQEAMSAKLGYAGTQHQLACVRTPFGYVFVDAQQGMVFTYKGQLTMENNMLNTFLRKYLVIKENNPYIGNGITIGYDPLYKRLLLTVKNKRLITGQAPAFTPELIPQLSTGDIVRKDGRFQKFLGVNATEFNCPAVLTPAVNNVTISVSDAAELASVLTTVTGTNVSQFILTTATRQFSLTSNGQLILTGLLNYSVAQQHVLNCKAVNTTFGTETTFTITVNVTATAKKPLINSAGVTLPERSANGTAVFTALGQSQAALPLTYSIVSGNESGAFTINSNTGAVTVADTTKLDRDVTPIFNLVVRATDDNGSADGKFTVTLTFVQKPLTKANIAVTVLDSTPNGTAVVDLDPAGGDTFGLYNFNFVSSTTSGSFSYDAATKQVKVATSSLNFIAGANVHVMTFTMSDDNGQEVTFTVTITVIPDLETLSFVPHSASCVTVSCAPGWTLVGNQCVRITTTPPTIIQENACVATSTQAAYGVEFARIYNPGFSNNSLKSLASTPDTFAQMISAYWNGRPNSCGVWVDTNCDGTKDSLVFGAQTTLYWNYNNTGAARRVYVGVFGDNRFTLKHNGVSIAVAENPTNPQEYFKIFHIVPVDIVPGQNLFNVVGTGDGSTNDAIGFIVYDNTAAQIQAATADGDLNILFTSASLRNTPSTIATCPDGYVLDVVNGAPICKKIENAAPTDPKRRQWGQVRIMRGTTELAIVNNQAGTTWNGIAVPYYAPIDNHVDCGGTVQHFLNAATSAVSTKNNCASGSTGSAVKYGISAGKHLSIASQADANNLAQTDLNTNKQAYANTNGTCS